MWWQLRGWHIDQLFVSTHRYRQKRSLPKNGFLLRTHWYLQEKAAPFGTAIWMLALRCERHMDQLGFQETKNRFGHIVKIGDHD